MPFSFGSSASFCYKKRQNILFLLMPPVLAAWTLLLCACVNPFYPVSGKNEGGGGSADPFSPVPGGNEGSVNPYGGYEAGLYKDNGGTWEPVPSVLPNDLASAFNHVNDTIVSGDFLVIVNTNINLPFPGGTKNLTQNSLIVATGGSIQITNPPGGSGGGVFRIQHGAELILEHSVTLRSNTAENNSPMVDVQDGTFRMKDGSIITGHTRSTSGPSNGGAGVFVRDEGTFTMEGGEISHNCVNSTTNDGGAVQVDGGTFIMEGGLIIDNFASEYGGGVLVTSGTFTMNGGTIARNTSGLNGGGVSVRGDSSATFTMSGGVIYGNRANGDTSRGGGVYCETGSFSKSGNSVIYGGNETGRDQDGKELKNSAGTGNSTGHAAYTCTSPTGYRDITAGADENLNSTSVVSPPWNM